MVQNPVPAVAAALVLTIPGIWLIGRWLARLTIDDLWLSRLAAPAFALAAWLIAVHVLGLASGSFEFALWTGSLTIAGAGHASTLWFRRNPPPAHWIPTNVFWIGTTIAAVAISAVAFRWAIHDDLFVTGHMSITAAIQNGAYPPPNLSFPQYELRYHYGFDLLNAAVTSVLRIPIDTGIDLLTVVLGGWTIALLWAVGDRVLGHGRGWIMAATVMLAGGMPLVCISANETVAGVLVSACSAGGINVNPPVLSYFFQHPWSIGLPIAIVVLVVFTSKRPVPLRSALISFLLIALALCQAVLFLALATGLVLGELWQGGKTHHWRSAGVVLLGSACAVIISTRLGGFFASTPLDERVALVLRPGIADAVVPAVVWHMASFGLVLPLGLIGLLQVPVGRLRTLGVALVAGSLLLLNSLAYAHSWDIVKFGNLALLGLAAATSLPVSGLVRTRRHLLSLAVLLGTTISGLGFLLTLALPLPGIPPGHFPPDVSTLTEDDVKAVEWLRREAGPDQVIYRSRPEHRGYAQWGGLPQAELDEMSARLGVPMTRLDQRDRLLRTLPAEIDSYLAEQIRWIVTAREDSVVNRIVAAWESAGSAVERIRFGDLRVIEIGMVLDRSGRVVESEVDGLASVRGRRRWMTASEMRDQPVEMSGTSTRQPEVLNGWRRLPILSISS